MKKCNNCGAELAPDAFFCANCGTKADMAALKPSKPVCPNPECKFENEEGALFCKKCGFKLGADIAITPITPIAPISTNTGWTLKMSFFHAFGQGTSFSLGLLKFLVINAGVLSEYTSGDIIQIPASSDILELEVAIRSFVGWKRGLKMKLRPKPQGTPAIDIEQDIWTSYPIPTARNVEILEQKRFK